VLAGVSVAFRFTFLHLLAVGFGEPAGTTDGRYILRFSDLVPELPLRFLKDVFHASQNCCSKSITSLLCSSSIKSIKVYVPVREANQISPRQ